MINWIKSLFGCGESGEPPREIPKCKPRTFPEPREPLPAPPKPEPPKGSMSGPTREHRVKPIKQVEYTTPENPLIINGIAYKNKIVTECVRGGSECTISNIPDEDHPITKKTREVQNLKYLGMLRQEDRK